MGITKANEDEAADTAKKISPGIDRGLQKDGIV
jgi:hypothetical protein